MYTRPIYAPALAFAIIGALSVFFVQIPATYAAIRDDEVYDLTRPLLLSRLTYTFLTDLPLLALQGFFISEVGLPPNFYIVKLSMTILSLFVSGWSLLRPVLDRYALLWGPMREHPRLTVLVLWGVFGVGVPLLLALGIPTTYPTGVELSEVYLLARKYSPPGTPCTFPEPTTANWTVWVADSRTPPLEIENSPSLPSGAPDTSRADVSPFGYKSVFTTSPLFPADGDITVFSVQEGLLWATRGVGDKYRSSVYGRWRMQFLLQNGFDIMMDVLNPSPYANNSVLDTNKEFTSEFWEEQLCLHTRFPAVVQPCSQATCDPTKPWIQYGITMTGVGLACQSGFVQAT